MTFLKSKSDATSPKHLSVEPQESITIIPLKLNLNVTKMPSIDIPPIVHKDKLSSTRLQPISISPRLVYHPAIVNACMAMFSKHPRNLTAEEVQMFKYYRNHKTIPTTRVDEAMWTRSNSI